MRSSQRQEHTGQAAAVTVEAGVEEGTSREGQGWTQSGGSWSGQGEELISRRSSWPAAPDHELGKGQPPKGRGQRVHIERAPKGALARSMRAARSMRTQQALGA